MIRTLALALLASAAAPASALDASALDARAPGAEEAELAASLSLHLQLRQEQVRQLDRIYESYAARRAEHAAVASRQADDLLAARARALKILTSIQRAQLEALSGDPRIQLQHDRYYQLLVMPVPGAERSEAPRRESRERHRKSARSKGRVSYGAYGGYSYGRAQYGVGVGYGRGPFGAHVGIGRGGPSVGVGVGGVLGRRW